MTICSTPLRVSMVAVFGVVLCLGGTVQAQSTRTMTDTIAVDPDVEVHAFRGRVEVTTWNRSAVRLHGETEGAASTADEASEIQATREDSTLTIRPNGKKMDLDIFTVLESMVWMRGEPNGLKTIYSIRVPTDASVVLKTDITWGGGVTSDFAIPDSASQEDKSVPIGGGGPEVIFESFSGSLTLRAE